VGVLVEGRLRQVGAPAELLGSPADPYVAEFAGANVIDGIAESSRDGLTRFRFDGERVVYSTDAARGRAALVLYPWDVSLARLRADDSALNHLEGEILSLVQVGNRVRVRLPFLTAEITAASAERLGLLPQLRARSDRVDKPDAQGFLGVDAAPGHRKLERTTAAEHPDERRQRDVREKTHVDLGQREVRLLGGQREIARCDDPQTARDRGPVDAGDDGLPQATQIEEQTRIGAPRLVRRERRPGGDRGEIGACAEGPVPCSGDAHDPRSLVAIGILQRGAQPAEEIGRESVSLRGSIQREEADRPAPLVEQRIIHRVTVQAKLPPVKRTWCARPRRGDPRRACRGCISGKHR